MAPTIAGQGGTTARGVDSDLAAEGRDSPTPRRGDPSFLDAANDEDGVTGEAGKTTTAVAITLERETCWLPEDLHQKNQCDDDEADARDERSVPEGECGQADRSHGGP